MIYVIITYSLLKPDDEAPEFDQCPGSIQTAADAGSTNATVTWNIPSFTDNSGSVNVSQNYIPPTVFSLGSYVVTYSATDPSGNNVICTFNVTVVGELNLISLHFVTLC